MQVGIRELDLLQAKIKSSKIWVMMHAFLMKYFISYYLSRFNGLHAQFIIHNTSKILKMK